MKKIWYIITGIALVIIGVLIWQYYSFAPIRTYAEKAEGIIEDSEKLPALNTETIEKLEEQVEIWEQAEVKAEKLKLELNEISVPDDAKKIYSNVDSYLVDVEDGYNEIRDILLIKKMLELTKIENTQNPQIARSEILQSAQEIEDFINTAEGTDIAIGPEFNDTEVKAEEAFENYLETVQRAYVDAVLGKDVSYIDNSYTELENACNDLIGELSESLKNTIKKRKELLDEIDPLKRKYFI